MREHGAESLLLLFPMSFRMEKSQVMVEINHLRQRREQHEGPGFESPGTDVLPLSEKIDKWLISLP